MKYIIYITILCLIIIGFVSINNDVVVSEEEVIFGSSWYNASWSNRKKITIDKTKVSSSEGSPVTFFIATTGLSNWTVPAGVLS